MLCSSMLCWDSASGQETTTLAIFKVFDDTNWAEEISGEKNRVSLIKRAFDDFTKENSGRAIRREAPLEQEVLVVRYRLIYYRFAKTTIKRLRQ